ncbi:MAG: DUF5915 domain-containing protein, partial [Streptosporangiales bacterium]
SLADLGERAGRDLSDLDPHRPYIDEVTLACETCGQTATRVPQVIDAWYDSGSMPFAQWGAPHLPGSTAELERRYPADFICEAIDQTRGWFYTLMTIGTLVFDQSPYRTVLCLGHLVDAEGRKMSKHIGNVLEPFPLMERHGADAVRWYLLAAGNPWATRRFGHELIDEVVRKVLLTYVNTASFLTLYANAAASGADGRAWTPDLAAEAPPHEQRPQLDRWVLSELHRTVAEVTTALEAFDSVRAGRRIAEFTDDLSNWYVRRSRRRFWQGFSSSEGAAAFATLYECVEVLTRLLAPFVPFTTDYVWEALCGAAGAEELPDSVHLASWPEPRQDLIDPRLADQMALARRLVELGRATRATSGVRTRQPLSRALIGAPGWADLPDELRVEVATELNVLSVEALGAGDAEHGELVEYVVKPNFRSLGRRFGKETPKVAAGITAADPAGLVEATRAGTAQLATEVGTVEVSADDILVTESPRAGWEVASDAGVTIALDLEVTPQLRRAGLAREAVRTIQEARRSAGFEVSDRIVLGWQADTAELAETLREWSTTLASEVLASEVSERPSDAGMSSHRDDALGLAFWLRKT